MRHTKGHTANRRSHHFLKGARFETCKDCGAKHIMHRVCDKCGKYRGRVVIDVLKKAMKKTKKEEGKKVHDKPEGGKPAKDTEKKSDAKEGKKTKKEQVGELEKNKRKK